METIEFIELLQATLSPIILLSGMGLIYLTSTNRLARTIDHSRLLANELDTREFDDPEKEKKLKQIRTLYKRSRILRLSILSTTFTIIAGSLLILCLFLDLSYQIPTHGVSNMLLFLIIIGIALSAICLFLEVRLTLKALELDIGKYIKSSN